MLAGPLYSQVLSWSPLLPFDLGEGRRLNALNERWNPLHLQPLRLDFSLSVPLSSPGEGNDRIAGGCGFTVRGVDLPLGRHKEAIEKGAGGDGEGGVP